ncbi:hypothetical protein AUR64_13020 [Haloprofundus marisrubri]|uniref:Uncharacterized protein n=1 Tax=Haloprofundus marisrubri TaxID=1514971 RepID=A0A0W1R865_9EURY|nr:hypothetical protein [Haloprofundus marisrubri]KTG09588.1 hypothetical protein AUR64_13020 [Haloprofundus marisrubri]
MQRRAAAISVAFFLLVGAASYSLIATAEEPTIQFENAEYELQQGDQFSQGGQQYTVTSLEAQMEGGGHGSAAHLTRSGQIAWTNDSAQYSQTWANNSSVSIDNESYRVVIPNDSDPSTFALREELNRTALLQANDSVDNQLVTRDGQQYVVYNDGSGNPTLIPEDQFFPDPSSTQYDEGQQFDLQGNQTTVENVTASEATLTWTAPRNNTIDVEDQANVTVGDQQYLAYFPANDTVYLTQNMDSYNAQQQEMATFNRHMKGLQGVTILAAAIAVLLIGLAYLPSRY